MRIWDIDPGYLNRQSLLGEHRELHGMYVVLTENRKGYAAHPETKRWKDHLPALIRRHELLVEEMGLRGFNHRSPLPAFTEETIWPKIFIDPPARQFEILRDKYRGKEQGRIPLPNSPGELWAQHKYSVLARDPHLYRIIGRWVAHRDQQSRFNLLSALLIKTLRRRPSAGRLRNSLEHMWGYISNLEHGITVPSDSVQLLQIIRESVLKNGVTYLRQSTALGEIGLWTRASPEY